MSMGNNKVDSQVKQTPKLVVTGSFNGSEVTEVTMSAGETPRSLSESSSTDLTEASPIFQRLVNNLTKAEEKITALESKVEKLNKKLQNRDIELNQEKESLTQALDKNKEVEKAKRILLKELDAIVQYHNVLKEYCTSLEEKMSGFVSEKGQLGEKLTELELELQGLKSNLGADVGEGLREKFNQIEKSLIEAQELMQRLIGQGLGEEEMQLFEKKMKAGTEKLTQLLKINAGEGGSISLTEITAALSSSPQRKWYENISLKNLSSRQMIYGAAAVLTAVISFFYFYYFAASSAEIKTNEL